MKIFEWVNGPGRAIAFVGLIVLLLFFGRDVLSSLKVRSEIGELRHRREALRQSIADDSILLHKLGDAEFLERFARENYLMRREGEEVYILLP